MRKRTRMRKAERAERAGRAGRAERMGAGCVCVRAAVAEDVGRVRRKSRPLEHPGLESPR